MFTLNFCCKAVVTLAFLGFVCLFLGSCSSNDQEKQIDLNTLYPSDEIVINTHGEWTKVHYQNRIQEFKEAPLENRDIVFLGNSITEGGGDWGTRFNNPKVKNRGISGDTTDGVLARLGEITYFKSAQVFMLIGINDLFRYDMSSQKVHDNIISIVRIIHEENPETKVYVQTILPTATEGVNNKVRLTNTLLKESESSEAYNLIRLHELFIGSDNAMNMEFSTDGVHLNEKGYNLWVNKVRVHIN